MAKQQREGKEVGTYAITGSAQPERGQVGIGGALRRLLVADGHDVISVDRRDAEVIVDLSTDAGRSEAIEAIRERTPDGLDGIATIAAVSGAGGDARALVNVNFFASIELVEGLRDRLEQRRGSAVLCSSHTFVLYPKEDLVDLYLTLDREKIEAGVEGRNPMSVYASGKKALVMWMRDRVPAYAADGIRLNAVVPGFTDTPMTVREGRSEKELEVFDDFQSKIPLGQRRGKPEEVAAGFRFLLRPDASFVNGVTLFVDGGHDTTLRPVSASSAREALPSASGVESLHQAKENQVKRRMLGTLEVSAIGLGCMSMTDSYGKADPEECERTLLRAVELGVTFFDTANAYGLGRNEQLLGRVLAPHRDQIQISTKLGFVIRDGRPTVDGRPEQVADRCDESLDRLGVDTIDLYFLHRPDPEVPIEETVGAMAELVKSGKVRHIGLCEVSSRSLRKAHAIHPIAAVQSEYSLWTRDPEAHVLPTCRELGVGFVPFSPIGRAVLTGSIDHNAQFESGSDMRSTMPRFTGENLERNLALVEELKGLATQLDVAPGQVALAWLLGKDDFIVPIPGTKRRRYLEENAGAAEITLDTDTMDRLDDLFAPEAVSGERYGAAWMRSSDTDD